MKTILLFVFAFMVSLGFSQDAHLKMTFDLTIPMGTSNSSSSPAFVSGKISQISSREKNDNEWENWPEFKETTGTFEMTKKRIVLCFPKKHIYVVSSGKVVGTNHIRYEAVDADNVNCEIRLIERANGTCLLIIKYPTTQTSLILSSVDSAIY